jgi:hypothetical protein
MRLTLPTSALFDSRLPERESKGDSARPVRLASPMPETVAPKKSSLGILIFCMLLFVAVVKFVVLGGVLGCG